MSISHSVVTTWSNPSGGSITATETNPGGSEVNVDGALATGSTNTQYTFAFTKAKLLSIYIYSDVVITIKTNSSGAPQETLTFAAGQAWKWTALDGLVMTATANPFAGNVTTIFVSNSSGSTANFRIRALVTDP